MKLYSYYRSTAAYRVRIALNYKGLDYEYIPVNLIQNQQLEQSYRNHNPQGRVPTLQDGNFELGQSMAILEYLEEKYPQPELLPKDIKARAWIRYFSQIIACDIHPLNNSGSVNFLRNQLDQSQEKITAWYHHWLREGFDALETLLKNNSHHGPYCWGSAPTFADLCLIPQVYNASRFEFSMENYPLIQEINAYCLQQAFFEKAIPENQPDYVNRLNTATP